MVNVKKQDKKKPYLKPWCEVDYCIGNKVDAVLSSGIFYGDDQDWDGKDVPEFPIFDWE